MVRVEYIVAALVQEEAVAAEFESELVAVLRKVRREGRRPSAQRLVAAVGADGPASLEEAVDRALARIAELEAVAEAATAVLKSRDPNAESTYSFEWLASTLAALPSAKKVTRRRRWSVNSREYPSLAAALEAIPSESRPGDPAVLYTRVQDGDPEHNLPTTTDGDGLRWIEVPTTFTDVVLAPGLPPWLTEHE